ncbi:MAG: Zn-ribbon domain-containing OB-fold protein [Chloroflexi bacterium]|nr:Zn-ribbon domain-containing OB-fold protein [Chloroflexota bacterium]
MSGHSKNWTTAANQVMDGSQVARGAVYSYTQVQEPAAGFEAQAPFHLALVELDQGGLITAQLTDVDGEVAIGDRVELVTRKLTTDGDRGMIIYGFKFRPAMK